MNKPRIILITQDFPPDIGGIQTWCVKLIEQFSSKGFDILVITKSYNGFEKEPFQLENTRVIRLEHENWKQKKNQRIIKTLKSEVNNNDIILGSNWKMSFPAALLRKKHIHIFTAFHGIDSFEHRFINKQFQKLTAKRSHTNIAVSTFTEGIVKSSIKNVNTTVINNGVEHSEFYPTEVPDSFLQKNHFDKEGLHVLNLGRLVPRKGFDSLIKATAEIPEMVLHIAGKGPQEEELKNLIKEKKVEERVIMHGFVPNSDMLHFYNATDVFAMPSKNIGTHVEGFGITYLEAAACGKPSIGSLNTGAEDAIEDKKSGLLVNPESIEDLTEKIKLFLDTKKRLDMGRYALERSKEFSWDKISDKYIELFKSALNS